MSDDFVFPTKADVKLARYFTVEWPITTPTDTKPLATALRMVAKREAVPPHYLTLVRMLADYTPDDLKRLRRMKPDDPKNAAADAADRAYVEADNRIEDLGVEHPNWWTNQHPLTPEQLAESRKAADSRRDEEDV